MLMAALLLSLAWRMLPGQLPSTAHVVGIGEEPNRVIFADAALLVGIEGKLAEEQRVLVAATSGGAAHASDATVVPLQWTFRFSIDRSRLRPPLSYVAEARGRRSSYHATIFLASGKTIEFGRNEFPETEPVQVSFQHSNFEPLLAGASFVLATCPQGVGETADVFFRGIP